MTSSIFRRRETRALDRKRRRIAEIFEKKAERERRRFRRVRKRFRVLNNIVELDDQMGVRLGIFPATTAGFIFVRGGNGAVFTNAFGAGVHPGDGNRAVVRAQSNRSRVADKRQQERKAENYFLE